MPSIRFRIRTIMIVVAATAVLMRRLCLYPVMFPLFFVQLCAICGLCLVYPKATAAILGRPVTYSVDQNRLEAGSRKECRLKWDGKPSTAVAITTSQSVDELCEQTSALRSERSGTNDQIKPLPVPGEDSCASACGG